MDNVEVDDVAANANYDDNDKADPNAEMTLILAKPKPTTRPTPVPITKLMTSPMPTTKLIEANAFTKTTNYDVYDEGVVEDADNVAEPDT